ncbi:MAG: magnesium and cobalt exporter, family, partial [Thermoleophilaceae bacterium]|nr:magnesium and cobalt exporter, family [Thermoleophilaceae bacterium]
MLVVLLLGVPALILMNAFFVATEYALVRSRLDRIQALTKEGAKGAALAEKQIERIDEYIAACQVGITLASIGIGAVGEPAIADLLKKPLGGVLGHVAATALAVAIGYTVLTMLHITLGELVPKIYTVGHAEGVARRFARPLEFFTRLFRPFSRILSAAAGAILRPFGVRPEGLGEETTTSEDLKFLIARSVSGGTL